jgi:Fis family transcriptional regulator
MSRQSIEECVRNSLEKYFTDLDGEPATNLYEMVMRTVEKPVLEVVMQHAAQNQSHAAAMLGINRNTLRKKLGEHGLL